ncbi:uncharacterized protein LOC122014111 [Zingiber officinale]|uniref:uncharacterized protein LOC122014111 n=1 Tax=Zingiber officinale TaxID=94328 RepID=UPI001C4C130D|nr:uncharacterized protein LOC122014111 [Zingiber officinale]
MLTGNKRKKVITILRLILLMRRRRRGQRPDAISLLDGASYVKEIIEGNPAHCQEMLRMKKEAFIKICSIFRENEWLKDSRYISVEEKMSMFLITLSHNLRVRFVKRRFCHSTQTINFYFHEVLKAMLKFSKEIIVPTQGNQISHDTRHKRLREVFKGAIGALDGTLVHAIVPINEQVRYRGRGKGKCYQNVLAICNFDMLFTFIWAGWEGVAHDSKVLTEIMRNPRSNFPFPGPDEYYLCDATYCHIRGFMSPHRNVRYWLGDFQRGGRARTKEELFNHAHAKLRNVIERTFGVLKARFPILDKMAPYHFRTQRDIVIACAAIHNFIRTNCTTDSFFEQFEDEITTADNQQRWTSMMESSRQADQAYMINLREEIGNQLFNMRF